MEQFKLFDPRLAAELSIVKNGWFNPSFTLIDGLNEYGKLSYTLGWRRTGMIASLQQSWTIEFGKLLCRDIFINDALTGITCAILKTSLWRGKVSLEFPDGQTFRFRRGPLFSRKHFWFNEQYGNMLTIETALFGLKRPFKVNVEPGIFKNHDYLLLMAFLSVHLILMRRRRAAATAY